LWETALTFEHVSDSSAVPRLADALYDANPDRRHAAARSLGWIWPVTRRAAKALIQALLDKSQPQPVREEAAESLAYSHYAPAIPPLISVLDEPDVRIRFWAVFALGGIGQWQTYAPGRNGADARVIEALERMLHDGEVPPGNWWSVGREALAMLGHLGPQYGARLDDETQRVLNDPGSSAEDLRWAKGYSLSEEQNRASTATLTAVEGGSD
jgi:HEAT repeat protein